MNSILFSLKAESIWAIVGVGVLNVNSFAITVLVLVSLFSITDSLLELLLAQLPETTAAANAIVNNFFIVRYFFYANVIKNSVIFEIKNDSK